MNQIPKGSRVRLDYDKYPVGTKDVTGIGTLLGYKLLKTLLKADSSEEDEWIPCIRWDRYENTDEPFYLTVTSYLIVLTEEDEAMYLLSTLGEP